jgi:hypothetical protein
MVTQTSKIKESVYAPQQVTTRNVIFKIEGIEELILVRRLTHHDLHLRR